MPQRTLGRTLLRQAARGGKRKPLTEAEQELLPYVQAEQAKQKRKINWLKPLELIFDLLSRGEYLTANVAKDIAMKKPIGDVLQGAWKGIKGERKGDWTKTLFGGQERGGEEWEGMYPNTPAWMQKKAKVPLIGPTSMEDVIGFLANAFIDPINLVSGGATKGAKAAAREYAEKTIKLTVKKLGNLDEFAKVARKGFDLGQARKLFTKNPDSAIKYLQKYASKNDIARFMNKVQKEAYREGLRLTPRKLQTRYGKNLTQDQARFMAESAEVLAKKGKKPALAALEGMGPKGSMQELLDYADLVRRTKGARKGSPELAGTFEDILRRGVETGFTGAPGVGKQMPGMLATGRWYAQEIENVTSDAFLAQFKNMGERGMNLFGWELMKGIREPNVVSKSFTSLMDSLKKTRGGEKFDDALWAVMNKGPVGYLRKLFGVNNPYQKMLRAKEMAIKEGFDVRWGESAANIQTALEGIDDPTKKAIRDVLGEADLQKIDFEDILHSPEIMQKLGLDEKMVGTIRESIGKIRGVTDGWYNLEEAAARKGLAPEYLKRSNYLPTVRRKKSKIFGKDTTPLGAYQRSFMKEKKVPLPKLADQEVSRIKWLFGLDEDTARTLVMEKNWSLFNMDLEEMLLHRGFAHSQMMTSAEMIDQFREFGIKFTPGPKVMMGIDPMDVAPEMKGATADLMGALRRKGMDIEELGLSPVKHPSLQGYLFDKDVAAIIDRVIPVASSDEGLNWFMRFAKGTTAWWKGMATLTPGFHLRNAQSNTFTLFVKFGPRALNPKTAFDSFIGSMYALNGMDSLKKLGISENLAERSLSKMWAGRTIRDWGDFARRNGVITVAQKGFDIESSVRKMIDKPSLGKQLNLLGKENVAFKGSRKLGSVVESTPRFQSFLMDIKDMAGEGAASEAMIDYAMRDAKKWFLDYQDLTEFEKAIPKNVMPFYTWLRKNTGRQICQMIEQKEMYALVPKFKGMIEQEQEVDMADYPEYRREAYPMQTGVTEEGKVRSLIPDLPYGDLNILPFEFEMTESGFPMPKFTPKETWDEFLSAAHPLIKTFATTMGYDPFRKMEIKEQEVAPRALRLLAANPRVLQFVDSVATGLGLEGGLNAGKDDKGRLVIHGKVAKVLEDNFIILRRLKQLGDTLFLVFPSLAEKLERLTGYADTSEGLQKFFKTMSFLLGIKQADIDMDMEESFRAREVLKKAEEARAKDRKKLPGYQERRRESINRMVQRRERLVR